MVLPATTRPAGSPTESQIGELITFMANIEKAIESKPTAARGRGKRVTFDATSYGPINGDVQRATKAGACARPGFRPGSPVTTPCAGNATLTRAPSAG